VVYGKLTPPRLYPTPVSVKDQWVGPHLCQRYGSGKTSSWLSTGACLFLTASLAVMGEKLNTDPWTGQSACCGLGREPFFSGAVDLFGYVDDYVKYCYALTA
jgi:hypothetical protein